MNIDQIQGNSYKSGKTQKGDASSKTNRGEGNSDSSEKTSGSTNNAADLSLSGSTFGNEVAFTKKVLSNSRQKSLASLKKIKQKINAGAYNNEAVHKKITSFIQKDLFTLQDLFSHSANNKTSPSSISTEHKNRLLENPEVTRKVADKIAGTLKKL